MKAFVINRAADAGHGARHLVSHARSGHRHYGGVAASAAHWSDTSITDRGILSAGWRNGQVRAVPSPHLVAPTRWRDLPPCRRSSIRPQWSARVCISLRGRAFYSVTRRRWPSRRRSSARSRPLSPQASRWPKTTLSAFWRIRPSAKSVLCLSRRRWASGRIGRRYFISSRMLSLSRYCFSAPDR